MSVRWSIHGYRPGPAVWLSPIIALRDAGEKLLILAAGSDAACAWLIAA